MNAKLFLPLALIAALSLVQASPINAQLVAKTPTGRDPRPRVDDPVTAFEEPEWRPSPWQPSPPVNVPIDPWSPVQPATTAPLPGPLPTWFKIILSSCPFAAMILWKLLQENPGQGG